MNKELLMRKIEAAIDAAVSSRMYGKLEIEFNDGRATFIRKLEQEKLLDSENNRATRFK
jgi:hypothetical protein